MYGNPEVTPGGRALKFYSSVRIEIRKTEVLSMGEGEPESIMETVAPAEEAEEEAPAEVSAEETPADDAEKTEE